MNKIFKGVMLSLLTVVGLASCSDSYEYTPADAPTGAQVYFPTSNPSSYTLTMSDDIQTINVPIERANTADAMTVGLQLTVAQNSAAFSIPTQVSFAAGESEAIVPLSYNAAALGYESSDTLYITIADDYSTSYGISTYKCIVNLPSPLKLLGTGNFVEGFWYEGENDVQIYQNELNPNIYRIMNPFNEMTEGDADGSESQYIDINILQPGETLAGVQITKKDLIYYAPINTGYLHSSYGDYVWMYHPAHFGNFATEDSWSHNKVVDWQENGLPGRIQLAPYYYIPAAGGGWNNTTADELVYIDFPGYEPKDFSVELSYAGILTDASNNVFAVGNLTLGGDVKTAKAVVMSASDDAAAVADAIAAGDLEAVNVAGGRIEIPVAEGLTGKLQLIAVVIDGGEVKGVSTANFEYYGGGASPWKSLGTGGYVDDFIFPIITEEGMPASWEVEIQESTETPGLYRLVNAYAELADVLKMSGINAGSGNENIEVHAENPKGVYILEQPIGIDLSSIGGGVSSIITEGGDYVSYYGDFNFVYQNAPELFGTLENGVITFPVFQSENGIDYQGYLIMGTTYYYGGTNGSVEIYLPSALQSNAKLKAKMESNKKAAKFARNLNAYSKKIPAKRAFSKKILNRNVKAAKVVKF